ncbi:MAG TPA: D-TA family PLP-dependent enzyme [Candidatus Baltobacteraceae bacterium]|nr:D-TA family PLP-dependent enzyme [Candidatus Baltobacteraceae bacterium]
MTLDIAWARGVDLSDVPSPALLLGLEPIQRNLAAMLKIADGPGRLRPHVKTHKLGWLVQRQIALGITRFKCATIAEAEMCAQAGAPDVLIAFQPVGPNLGRLITLQEKYPQTKFSTIVDDAAVLQAMEATGARLEILVDLDVGQHRTGIPPGPAALALYRQLAAAPGLVPGGLHAYDGHLSQSDPAVRAAACAEAFAPVWELRDQLLAAGLPVPRVVAGGTPTFPMHAARQDVECSPGTTVLWDASYATRFHDLHFSNAAVLLTRVVSKPGGNRLCLDLGHKAVASEMPHPRVVFPDLPDAQFITHSEEHLLLESAGAARLGVGDEVLGVPWHVCPTVALHGEAVLIEQGNVTGSCRIEARARKLTV